MTASANPATESRRMSWWGTNPVRAVWVDGGRRNAAPTETMERLGDRIRACGITRIADVTGLDTIGIPTYMVVRPNSRSLAVSQGKGTTRDAARVAGVMESLELYCAERPRVLLRLASADEMEQDVPALTDGWVLPNDSAYTRHRRILWTTGRSLRGDEEVWVPFELVHTDFRLPPPTGSGCFHMTSNGLASGNDLPEALLHGLCELIERDATSLVEIGPEADRHSRRVDVGTVDDPTCLDLLERFERAQVDVLIWDQTSDIGVASFHALILERDRAPFWALYGAIGHGCHPDRGIALVRALTEAAQTRLTLISGSRDDMHRRAYERKRDPQRIVSDETAREVPGRRRFEDIPTHHGATIVHDLEWVLERLLVAGLGQVVAVDLSPREIPISVVRVLAPQLEPSCDVRGYVPGRRARRRQAL